MTINLFDRTLKIIARNHAATFLRLAFPNQKVRLTGTLQNVEISLSVKPVDFVHQVIYDGRPYLFHLEFQTKDKGGLPRRTFITSAELTDQYKLPVLTVFIYLRPQQKAISNKYRTKLGQVVINEFTYPVIKLWDFITEIKSGQLRELAPLLPMLVAEPNESLLAEERELILAEADPQKRADLLAAAIAIGSLFFEKQFLWYFFREEVAQMKKAEFIDDWITEGVERGYADGYTKGIQRGIQRGRVETIVETIVETLMIRFNKVPKRIIKRIDGINELPILNTLYRHAVTVPSMADFERLLIELLEDDEEFAFDSKLALVSV